MGASSGPRCRGSRSAGTAFWENREERCVSADPPAETGPCAAVTAEREREAGREREMKREALPKACLRKSLCAPPSINANPSTPREGEFDSGSVQAHGNYLHQIRMRTSVDNILRSIIQSSLALRRSCGEGAFYSVLDF